MSILAVAGYKILRQEKINIQLSENNYVLNKESNLLTEEFTKLVEEFAKHKVRSSKVNSDYTSYVRNSYKLGSDLKPCFEKPYILNNLGFDKKIPYFLNKQTAERTYSIQFPELDSDITPILFLPKAGKQKYPVKFVYDDNAVPQITFDFQLLSEELKAYDFAVVAVLPDNAGNQPKPCKIDARVHVSHPSYQPPKPLHVFGRLGFDWGRFRLPYGTDIDEKRNTILISDCTSGLIQEMDFKGNLVRLVGTELYDKEEEVQGFLRPADVKLANGKIFVVEEEGYRYQVFDREGRFLEGVGREKKYDKLTDETPAWSVGDNPEFNNPLGIAVDKYGKIFVVDYANYRIQKLDSDGKVIKIWGWKEEYDGKPLDGPYYIDIDHKLERVYIGDRGNHRIVAFDLDGNFLFSFGSEGSQKGQMDTPHELDVTKDGRIFVADTYNYRVQIFDSDGKYMDMIDFGVALGAPKTVAVSEEGIVLVGHLGKDAFMTVWADPMNKKSGESILAQIDDMAISQAVDLSNQKKIIHNHFKGSTYKQVCVSCHASGALGAPRSKVSKDWNGKSKNMSVLLASVREGKGKMLPSGGCESCSDEELIKAIETMLPEDIDYTK